MKKYFFSGLAILLPIVLTLIILMFLVNFLTKPFVGIVSSLFAYYGVLNQPFLFLSGPQVLLISSKVSALIGVVLMIFLAGFLAQAIIVSSVGRLGNYLIHKIPLINTIYKSIQDVVETLFTKKKQDTPNFSSVVLVPFPHGQAYSLGFITNTHGTDTSDEAFHHDVSVFVPGTPNPTMGFMLQYKSHEVIPLKMRVEDAVKFIMSIGVICPEGDRE